VDLGLHQRVALVTGATGGIGSSIARRLGEEGAAMALGYHANATAAEEARVRRQTVTVAIDLHRPESLGAAVADVLRQAGRLDVLVANAVAWGARRAPGTGFEDVGADEWEPLIRANLLSAVELVRHAVKPMRAGGWGRIVLISSHAARHGRWGHEYYAAAKVGLHGFARSVAWDLARDNILINVVCPDTTATPRVLKGLDEQTVAREGALRATGRLVEPSDVAALTAFLCSAVNQSITGQVIDVSGGR
jgi:3-oxoacyl-[acyl-carrier protein] reductase